MDNETHRVIIPWNDGTKDNIYLDIPSFNGNATITISSDILSDGKRKRSRDITFVAKGRNDLSAVLTVRQLMSNVLVIKGRNRNVNQE